MSGTASLMPYLNCPDSGRQTIPSHNTTGDKLGFHCIWHIAMNTKQDDAVRGGHTVTIQKGSKVLIIGYQCTSFLRCQF